MTEVEVLPPVAEVLIILFVAADKPRIRFDPLDGEHDRQGLDEPVGVPSDEELRTAGRGKISVAGGVHVCVRGKSIPGPVGYRRDGFNAAASIGGGNRPSRDCLRLQIHVDPRFVRHLRQHDFGGFHRGAERLRLRDALLDLPADIRVSDAPEERTHIGGGHPPAEASVPLEQGRFPSSPGGGKRRGHPGRTASDNQNVVSSGFHTLPLFHKRFMRIPESFPQGSMRGAVFIPIRSRPAPRPVPQTGGSAA